MQVPEYPSAPNTRHVAPLEPYDADLLIETYRRMVLIRQFELKVNELFLQGIMPGTIHLSLGPGKRASSVLAWRWKRMMSSP